MQFLLNASRQVSEVLTLFLVVVRHSKGLQVGDERSRVVGCAAGVHGGGPQREVHSLGAGVELELVQRVQQAQRVFAARQTHQHAVAVANHLKLLQRLRKQQMQSLSREGGKSS